MRSRHIKRRRRKRFNVARRLGLPAICVLGGFFAWFAFLDSHEIVGPQPPLENRSSASTSTEPLTGAKAILSPTFHPDRPVRVIYPYSVIPGGVKTVDELKNAIAKDPVVSAHYAEFHLERARIIRLDRERSNHVSYRLGSKVYWTKRELKLAKGETFITDGALMARTRCGNLISAAVLEPASLKEPTVQELDAPQDPQDPQDADVRLESDPTFDPSLTHGPGSGASLVEEGSPSSHREITPIVLGPSGSPGASPWPGPSTPTRVVAVPEPGTLILLSITLFALILLRKS